MASLTSENETSCNESSNWQQLVLCKYFMNGSCNNGDDCLYSHDSSIANRRSLPCKYYSNGTCAYGNDCRFSHNNPQNSSNYELDSRLGQLSVYESTLKVNAPEFIPSSKISSSSSGCLPKKTWAKVVRPESSSSDLSAEAAESQLCPYYIIGECRYGEHCVYIHGHLCDLCNSHALHPTCESQRKNHKKDCLTKHEAAMEFAFQIARSKDKTCGICMETIVEKSKGEARFGILPNCNHCFCLSCLRTWRQAKQFEHKIVRACPECRQTSDYICPSRYWVETKEEKEGLFSSYKIALNAKECKYFNKGLGECPFGNKCFYRHCKDGRDVDVGPPQRRLHLLNSDDELAIFQRVLLNTFLDEREGRIILPMEYLELIDFLSDTEDEF